VSGYEAKDAIECPQANGIMVRDRDSLMGRIFGLEDQVTILIELTNFSFDSSVR
jgi:hypothetical protein